ncbi:restriction endonuclease [Moraxella osloensis]|nr:restriction endonuclease [Moraxella sp. CTOTU47618]QCR86780.1 restriction endonuclease [Moraxella osloensis]
MGETANITKLPPFGDLLNSGIQTLKNLSGRSSISQNLFFREFDKVAQLSDDQKSISYLSQFDIQNEYEEGTPCYEPLTNLILMCLSAMGVIKENCFSLQPNIGKEFASLITFDEKVTIKNLVRIDPLGKIFFWLANENFSQYLMKGIPNNDYIANLKRFDEKSFQDLKKVNQVAYGKRGDPLINYFINETTRRTSLFMNNYQDAMVSDGNVKVTPDMILTQLDNLTPLQFEWFCLKLVERSLENESPESNLSSHHTGKANDGGIDGMITQIFSNEERHTYYIQAKLYSQGNNISNRELRNFVGGYPPQKDSHHGIFITTTSFTKPALDYFENLESHSLILIDQMALIELMMEHEVGLKQVDSKPKLVLDNDFFEKIKRY